MNARNLVAGFLMTVAVCGCASPRCQVAPEAPTTVVVTSSDASAPRNAADTTFCQMEVTDKEASHPIRDRLKHIKQGCQEVLLFPVKAIALTALFLCPLPPC